MTDDIERLRNEMSVQFEYVRKEIKDLASALVELVRLEGKLDRTDELVMRLGAENDDQERRIRALESSAGINSNRLGNAERFIWLLVSACVGLVVFFVKSGAT